MVSRQTIINNLKEIWVRYSDNYRNFLNTGRQIELELQSSSEVLSGIRHLYNNLTATVELIFEGITVLESEINKAKGLLQDSIKGFDKAISISQKLNQNLNNITVIFQKIISEGDHLGEIIKNINIISESIEVASRNAGITAFHAGRQGRGFEVIAREMSNLVRSSQIPTKKIPTISNEVINKINELTDELKKIQEIISNLNDIAGKFSGINDELLTLIPHIENSIKDIGGSIATQKNLNQALIKENEKLPEYLQEIHNFTRSSVVIEMFLTAFFQHINDIKNVLFQVQDDDSFFHFLNTLKIILFNAPDFKKKIGDAIDPSLFKKLETQSSERLILQFVSEANHLNEIIADITHKTHNWLKIYKAAEDVLTKATLFHQEILNLLNLLQNKLTLVNETAGGIEQPLLELKKITERSKLLGLYAGIESARSLEYSTPLGVVTSEIKLLSAKTREFVSKIDEIRSEITLNLKSLISYFICGANDVEEGIGSINSAVSAVNESSKVLENLDSLSREMLNSTREMVNQCGVIGEKLRIFNDEYKMIGNDFNLYFQAIKASSDDAKRIKDAFSEFEKEVAFIKHKEKIIVYREVTDPIILDPANKTDMTSHQVIVQVFYGLLSFNNSNSLIPGIVESFSVSPDGKLWDFLLKKDVKFHNGAVVTAQDVANSLQRVKKGPNANIIEYVKDIRVIDNHHIQFTLDFPYIPFLSNLASGICDIVPPDFSADNPIGCGPYRFVHWGRGKEIILDAFDDFYDGRPVFDRCIIKTLHDDKEAVELFKRGEISIMEVTPPMFDEFNPEEIISGPVLSTQYISINVRAESPFKDSRIRQALNYALNKDFYVNEILKGRAILAKGIFPPNLPAYNNNLRGYPYDLKRARDLMKEAGYPSGLSDSIIFDIRDDTEVIKRAEFIKESFEKIGVNLKLNPLPWKEFLEKIYSGNSLMSLRGWISDNGDPDNFLFPLFHSKSFGTPGNTSFYSNPEIDSLIEAARAEQIVKRRIEMYQKIEQMLVDEAPWVFLSHGVDCYVIQKNIGGFNVDPFGVVRFRYLWG